MPRVKIKSPTPKDPGRLNLLLQILSLNNIYATRIINTSDGFAVVTDDEKDLDKIFDGTTDRNLEDEDFEPLVPPEHRANRSVLVFKIDDHIYQQDEDDITTEILTQNDWIRGITYTEKFKKGRGLKITFSDTTTCKKVQENGLLLFSMRIPPSNLIQDKYLNISTCLRCYKIDQHYTSNCPKDRAYKICSECSQEGHTWRECKESIKQCINCSGNHSTMAMSCKIRKEKINNKRREERERPRSYVAAAKQGLPFENQVKFPDLDIHTKILQCMYQANMYNMVQPGSYERVVNGMFHANNLPKINIPEECIPPSELIITKLLGSVQQQQLQKEQVQQEQQQQQQQQQKQQQQQQQKQQQQKQQQQQEKQQQVKQQQQQQEPTIQKHYRQRTESEASGRGDDTQPAQAASINTKQQEKTKSKKTKISGQDIGLTIYTTRTLGFPEIPLKKHSLLEGIRNKTIKYTYENARYTESEIMERFVFGLVDTTDCLVEVEVDRFRKIQTGLKEMHRSNRPEKLARKESL